MADPEAGESTATADDGGSSQGSDTASSPAPITTASPVGSITGSLRKTLHGIISTFGSGRTPGQPPSTGADSSTVEPGGSTETAVENEDSGAAVASPVEPVPAVVEPVTNVEPAPSVVEPAPTADASAPSVVAAPSVAAPSVMAVPNVMAPVSTLVAALVGTTTDVIALVESMAASAAGAALMFTSLQPDLSALLGITVVDPLQQGVAGRGGMGPSAPADTFLTALHSPVVPLQTGIPGVTWADAETGTAPLGWGATTLLGQQSPLPEAGAGSDGLIPVGVPVGVRNLFQGAFDELRRTPALAALLNAALPGVAGLLFLTGVGMRLGYRQAKAGFALRMAGIVRFAPTGPIGVVRSGSMVFVRPRALHVVRPRALHVVRSSTLGAECVLDEAA